MAKPLGPKSIAIRDVLKNHATMGNKEVAELLTNRHPDLKVTPQDVANQRTALGKLARGERDEEEGPLAAPAQQQPAQQQTVPNYLTGQTTAAPVAAASPAAASPAAASPAAASPAAASPAAAPAQQPKYAKFLAIREAIDDNPMMSDKKIVEIVERTHPDLKVTPKDVMAVNMFVASMFVADYEEEAPSASMFVADYEEEAPSADETQFTAQLRALVQLLGKETVKRMVDSL